MKTAGRNENQLIPSGFIPTQKKTAPSDRFLCTGMMVLYFFNGSGVCMKRYSGCRKTLQVVGNITS